MGGEDDGGFETGKCFDSRKDIYSEQKFKKIS